jgi:hypothetical protein
MYIHEPIGISIHEPTDRAVEIICILDRAAILSVHTGTLSTWIVSCPSTENNVVVGKMPPLDHSYSLHINQIPANKKLTILVNTIFTNNWNKSYTLQSRLSKLT